MQLCSLKSVSPFEFPFFGLIPVPPKLTHPPGSTTFISQHIASALSDPAVTIMVAVEQPWALIVHHTWRGISPHVIHSPARCAHPSPSEEMEGQGEKDVYLRPPSQTAMDPRPDPARLDADTNCELPTRCHPVAHGRAVSTFSESPAPVRIR